VAAVEETLAALISPTAAGTALAVAAVVSVPGAWYLVRRGRVAVWGAMGSLMAVLGVIALVVGGVRMSGGMSPLVAAGLGALAGAALYGATAGFMFVAGRWPPLRSQAQAIYDLRGGRSLPAALAVSCLAVAPGEELVWRGVVQPLLGVWLGSVGGAVSAWVLYVAANTASLSLPIVLGAVVGGAAWAALALVTGGVAASIACHIVWTGLMVAFPPVFEGRR
jgi:membrane protease YdiL (CAAX protease family)